MAVCRVTHFLCAAGARRGILNIPGVEEDVGLIGIHWQGKFIELVPWNSAVSWEIAPWGQWKVSPYDCVSLVHLHHVCLRVIPISSWLLHALHVFAESDPGVCVCHSSLVTCRPGQRVSCMKLA